MLNLVIFCGRGGTRMSSRLPGVTLDLTDVNRDPLFPNLHPHGYPENTNHAETGKTIHAEVVESIHQV